MGVHKNIGLKKFPKQGEFVGCCVNVCFNYDASNTVEGIIVRDDKEDPYQTIIKLDNGKFVTANECQYSIRIDQPGEKDGR